MTTWTLILAIQLPTGHLSLPTIEGFPTMEACTIKGNQTVLALKPQRANSICIEVSR